MATKCPRLSCSAVSSSLCWELQSPNRCTNRGWDIEDKEHCGSDRQNHSLRTPLFSLRGSHCTRNWVQTGEVSQRMSLPLWGPLSWSDPGLTPREEGACQPLLSAPSSPVNGASLGAALVPGASQNANRSSHWELFVYLSASTSEDEPWEGAPCLTVCHRAAPTCGKAWRRPCARDVPRSDSLPLQGGRAR